MFGKKDKQTDPQADDRAPTRPGDAPDGHDAPDAHDTVDETQQLIDTLRAERDEAKDRLTRALADYQNYQRRALNNEQEARRQGVTAVVNSVVPVLDHFDLALAQTGDDPVVRGVIEGVRVIRAELIKALESHGVRVISPKPNDQFDPSRHAAIAQAPGEGVGPGNVSATYQVGYEFNDRVIRPAKVAVSPRPD